MDPDHLVRGLDPKISVLLGVFPPGEEGSTRKGVILQHVLDLEGDLLGVKEVGHGYRVVVPKAPSSSRVSNHVLLRRRDPNSSLNAVRQTWRGTNWKIIDN